jgi:hypothetical protein
MGGKLFVVGRVQQRKWNGEISGMEFRINRIEPLFEVREKMGRYLDIQIPLELLNEDVIEKIATRLKNGTGKTQVRMHVRSKEGDLKLPASTFNKVSIGNDVLKELDEVSSIEWSVSES